MLIDASPEVAASGQAARGRTIPARSMRRHAARWSGLLQAAADQGTDAVLVVDRRRADRLTVADVLARPGAAAGR